MTEATVPASESAPTQTRDLTPTDLGDMFAQARQTPERDEPATEPESAQAESAAPVEEQAPGEATTEAEPAELPLIEPPRSWTQAEKERFQSLPRETQEYLHTREQERDREFRRSQNEIAEQRKSIENERKQAEQVRQQYEAALPTLMQTLRDEQSGQFSDIRTVDDVTKLASEDPFRYLQWQAHQTKLQAVNAETERVRVQRSQAEQSEWVTHVAKENELAAEFIPELADKVKGPALTQRVATELLPELGFKDSELVDLVNGRQRLTIFDHRVQRLLADSLKLRDIQKAKVVAAVKPVPQVQRPGVAKPQGSRESEAIQNLSAKLERSGSPKDLGALIGALRRA